MWHESNLIGLQDLYLESVFMQSKISLKNETVDQILFWLMKGQTKETLHNC